MAIVAYITSGKIGIPRFTYNELSELEKQGVNFYLCLTQLNKGPWMPKEEWYTFKADLFKSFIVFVFILLFRPIKLLQLLIFSIRVSMLPYFLISLSFYFDLRKKGITSLHCQMGDKKIYIGYFLKCIMGIPLTATIHAHELYQREVYDHNEYIRWLYAHCDHIITISEFNADILREEFGIPSERISVMRLFPEVDHDKLLMNRTKILIVANWAEKKGYLTLIKAVKEIVRDDFVILVVGGSYNSTNSIDLLDMIKKEGIENKFLLLGRQGGYNLELIFSACDIFCLPSFTEYYRDGKPAEREGIPVALMEAMAWGKPVISTKHAGIPELVEEVLVNERDPQGLKQAIEYLLDNPQKWKDMGLRNQNIIKERYSKSNVLVLKNIFNSFNEH